MPDNGFQGWSKLIFRLLFTATLACIGAAGCSGDDGTGLPGRQMASSEQFSADEKRAARSLSIGTSQISIDDSGLYGQALNCSVALTDVIEALSSEGQPPPQIETIRHALNIYERRALDLSETIGKSPSDVLIDRATYQDERRDLREAAQIGIGCLRNLT